MNVYVVLSEMLGDVSDPDYGRVAAIVVAETHTRARYLALKSERLTQYAVTDWPRCTTRKLGELDQSHTEGVLKGEAAEHFWALVPESLDCAATAKPREASR